MFLSRKHQRRKAAGAGTAYSPIWGNCIIEADPGVPETMDHELGPAHYVVRGSCVLYILPSRFNAEAEDCSNFPVGFPSGDKAEAFQLTPTEVRVPLNATGMYAPSGAKSMGSDEFCAQQAMMRECAAAANGKRA
jgi:hypothetical protein